ncbi:MAG: TatD family nuclease-associated radical SAM protein [Clostridiales bacterium]|nr:TatD family nuclease-associated radical SAM protein [Clostridiales bacterium]
MADIIYLFEGSPYFNITNKCPCNCVFCIREKKDVVGEAKKMWHDVQPTFDDVKAAIDAFDWSEYDHAVFCGYGEPTNELELLLKSAAYMKEHHPNVKLRLNTNGLSDLINAKPTAELICRYMDAVSVSLNETTSEKYDKITRNIFPGKAFDAMLRFTKDCVKYCHDVRMTVVDVISEKEIADAQKICASTGANFMVRRFVPEN